MKSKIAIVFLCFVVCFCWADDSDNKEFNFTDNALEDIKLIITDMTTALEKYSAGKYKLPDVDENSVYKGLLVEVNDIDYYVSEIFSLHIAFETTSSNWEHLRKGLEELLGPPGWEGVDSAKYIVWQLFPENFKKLIDSLVDKKYAIWNLYLEKYEVPSIGIHLTEELDHPIVGFSIFLSGN